MGLSDNGSAIKGSSGVGLRLLNTLSFKSAGCRFKQKLSKSMELALEKYLQSKSTSSPKIPN